MVSTSFCARIGTTMLLVLLMSLMLVPESVADADEWQECEIFLAPSRNSGMGWGVFAARDFAKGEIVERVPLFVPVPERHPVVVNTIVDDYDYGYIRYKPSEDPQDQSIIHMHIIAFGGLLIYNHHGIEPNVVYTSFGMEPNIPKVAQATMSVGMVARRDIKAGEELFSSYGEEDGGAKWFSNRKIPLHNVDIPNSKIPDDVLQQEMQKHCSHIQSGMAKSTWSNRVTRFFPPNREMPFHWQADRMPPFDAGAFSAVAKHAVAPGERLEMGPALLLPRYLIHDTAFSALGIYYQDLEIEHKQVLQDIAAAHNDTLWLQYQGSDTSWARINRFRYMEAIVLLPVAGWMALVPRAGPHDDRANCRMALHPPFNDALSPTIELIATKPIQVGERLWLNFSPPRTVSHERELLAEELVRTGQVHLLAPDIREALIPDRPIDTQDREL